MVMFFGGVALLLAGSAADPAEQLILMSCPLFLSFALEPAVDWLAQRWRRGSATGLVLAVLFVGTVLFLGAGKLVVDSVGLHRPGPSKGASGLGQPHVRHEPRRQDRRDNNPIHPHLASWPATPPASASALGVVFQFFTILLFTFTWWPTARFRRTICVPASRTGSGGAGQLEIAIRRPAATSIRGCCSAGSRRSSYLAFVLIGVPYALALALFVGLVSQFVPVVGNYIAERCRR
jgi:hypothetical protein